MARHNVRKYRWADETQPVHAMTVYARSLKGRALAAWGPEAGGATYARPV
jgi:hypothetical protein